MLQYISSCCLKPESTLVSHIQNLDNLHNLSKGDPKSYNCNSIGARSEIPLGRISTCWTLFFPQDQCGKGFKCGKVKSVFSRLWMFPLPHISESIGFKAKRSESTLLSVISLSNPKSRCILNSPVMMTLSVDQRVSQYRPYGSNSRCRSQDRDFCTNILTSRQNCTNLHSYM